VLGLTIQQVRRAIQEAASRTPRVAPSERSAPPAPGGKVPTEELHVLVLLVTYPELMRTPDATRAGELLIDPTMRQLYRAASEQFAGTGTIEVPAWLEVVPPDSRRTIVDALGDRTITEVRSTTGQLGKLVVKLELLRVDAEILMNDKQLAIARSDGDEQSMRAFMRRNIELNQRKRGLQAALERP